jgi:hypothetical protein
MEMAASVTDLPIVLEDFKTRFNTNPRVKRLVDGWNRLVVLDASDTSRKFGLVVRDTQLVEVQTLSAFDDGAGDLVHLQAEEHILRRIFAGDYNPATALTDGNLAVFSKDRDKVKLEALAMLIWRLG